MNLVAKLPDEPAAATPPEAASPEPPLTVLRPPRGWQLINFRELWQFRDLLYFLTWRDVKVRYKQTILGALWALLQPALMMVVFTLFFAKLANVATGSIPYPLFVYAGLLPWTFFATAVANGAGSVVGQERLITKIYFPRLAVPFAAAGAAVIDFLVACSLMLILMLAYGVVPGWGLFMLPVLVLLLLLTALGVGTLLAALNVAYRDVRYVIPFLIQLWMFATPSIYLDLFANVDALAQDGLLRTLLALNPLTGLIAAFRAALVDMPIPWHLLGYSAAAAALLFLAGCLYFRKVEDRFADVI